VKSPEQNILKNPSLKEALKIIRFGISRKKTVLIIGRCFVEYEGRASSKLELGERIVIFKPDGSALVHRTSGYAPVNWQPPGSLYRTRLVNEKLVVRVFRKKENEVLEVFFEDILLVATLDLKDSGEFYLYASEEDMKQAILTQPEILEKGFRPIASERPVEPGFIDILGMDRNNTLTIVEIKRRPATKEAVFQLKKYVDVFTIDSERKVRGILVAPSLARGTQKTLATLGLEFKALQPQECAFVLKNRDKTRITDYIN